MRNRIIIGALSAAMALSALPAGAENSLSATATRDGATASVTGLATIVAPEGPLDIGSTVTPFAGTGTVPQDLGIELEGAEVELTDEGVTFVWKLTDLPDSVPPEGVRYTWSFAAGGQTFQLQAKRSNVASITTAEDPVGHAQQAASGADWFQLRGACEDAYQGAPVAGCYHLAFLDGAFDAAADTVTMEVPFGTTDRIGRLVGDTFRSGVEITPVQTAGASITGSFQAVVSTTTLGSFMTDWTPVFTGPTVQLGVGRPGANPASVSYTSVAALAEDGSFAGQVSGLSATNSSVFVRACHGLKVDCATQEIPQG